MSLPAALDHLVVAASTLDEGVAWCERVLGVTPGPGGQHALFGTHNRLLRIATVDFPLAYLEIIAIDPDARPEGSRTRWFDLDDPALQRRLREQGPQLVHWVARVPALEAALTALTGLGLDRGRALATSRPTPRGLLRWSIAVRDDGQRLMDGCLPTLLEWGEVHPAASMADSGLSLHGLQLRHPRAALLRQALAATGLDRQVSVDAGPPGLCATLAGPGGRIRLAS